MVKPLINRLEQADSGLFIHAPEGTCQQVAEVLGDAGKSHAGLTEAEDCQLAIEQLAIQLAVEPAHTIAATLEVASRLIGEPIYLLIDHAERLEQSDLTYALKAARDALASSELAGLRLAFFSTDRAVLERMTRRQSAPFFCAQTLDVANELSWNRPVAFRAECDEKVQNSTSNAVLIIDLENTCLPESERPADYHHQIIEIGAAWVTPMGEVMAKFSTLVQAENPVPPFCTDLLGITQADVDGGLPFAEAMQALARFSSLYPSTTWASWGTADLKSLNADCAHHGLESPLAGWTHRNLKKEWAKARKINRVGMKMALELDKIELEGAHHRALDDALNIAKLMPRCGNHEGR